MLVYSLKKKLRKDRKETNTSGVTSERMWEMGGGRNRVAAGLFTMYLKESSVKMYISLKTMPSNGRNDQAIITSVNSCFIEVYRFI